MKNYLVTRNNNPGMSFSLYILSGSRKDNIPGTAHFLEHMLATAYEEDEKQLESEILELGVEHNAWTSRDFIKLGYTYDDSVSLYNEEVWKKSVDFFRLKFERAINGQLFKKNWIDKERPIILNEELLSLDDHKINDRIFLDVSTDYKTSARIIGDQKSIKKVNKKVLWEYTKENLVQDNIFIVMSLPIYLTKEEVDYLVQYLIDRWMSVIPKGKYNSFLDKDDMQLVNDLRKDLPSTLKYEGFSYDAIYGICDTCNLSYAEHKVLAEILNQWSFKAIRQKHSLCYSAGCGAMIGFRDGKLCFSATSERENNDKIFDIWLSKLNNLSITKKEKDTAIMKIRTAYELSIKNPIILFIEDTMHFGDFKYLKQIMSKIDKDPYYNPYIEYRQEITNMLVSDKARKNNKLQTFKDLGKYCADHFTKVFLYKKEEKE